MLERNKKENPFWASQKEDDDEEKKEKEKVIVVNDGTVEEDKWEK